MTFEETFIILSEAGYKTAIDLDDAPAIYRIGFRYRGEAFVVWMFEHEAELIDLRCAIVLEAPLVHEPELFTIVHAHEHRRPGVTVGVSEDGASMTIAGRHRPSDGDDSEVAFWVLCDAVVASALDVRDALRSIADAGTHDQARDEHKNVS